MSNAEKYQKEITENAPILNKIGKLGTERLVEIFEDLLRNYCVDTTYIKLAENKYTANFLTIESEPINVVGIKYKKNYYDSVSCVLSSYSCSVYVKKEHSDTKLVFSMPFKHFVKIYCNEKDLSK